MINPPFTRDLVGYRGAPPAWRLPKGAALDVSLVVNFEEGAELSTSDGDPATQKMSEGASVDPPGRWEQRTQQILPCAMRAGIWRILDRLRRHNYPTTFYMCGRAVERVPEIARQVVAAGHEAACHGWRWRPHADYAHAAPGGHLLGRAPPADGVAADLPYWERRDALRPILGVPYALDSNDMKFFHPNGFVCADDMTAYVRDAIDVLLEEGEAGHPKLLNIGFHLRIAGRPRRCLRVPVPGRRRLLTRDGRCWHDACLPVLEEDGGVQPTAKDEAPATT